MSVQRIGKNKYRVVAKQDLDGKTGKYHYADKVFSGTHAEALEYEKQLSNTKYVDPSISKMTVRKHMEDWLENIDVEANTKAYYRRSMDIDILPKIGHLRLRELDAYVLERCLNDIPEGSKRRRAKKTLSASIKKARKWNRIDSNPMLDVEVRIGGKKRAEKEAYTLEEAVELLALFESDHLFPGIVLGLFNGLREEEICGIGWDRVRKDSIVIDSAYTMADGKPHEKGTKTGDAVVLPLSQYASELLEPLRQPGHYVIEYAGKRIRPDSVQQHFSRVVKRSGMRYVPFGSLRHAFATIALDNGDDIATVSSILRHARVSTTADSYLRPMKRQQTATVDKMGRAFEVLREVPKSPKTQNSDQGFCVGFVNGEECKNAV